MPDPTNHTPPRDRIAALAQLLFLACDLAGGTITVAVRGPDFSLQIDLRPEPRPAEKPPGA